MCQSTTKMARNNKSSLCLRSPHSNWKQQLILTFNLNRRWRRGGGQHMMITMIQLPFHFFYVLDRVERTGQSSYCLFDFSLFIRSILQFNWEKQQIKMSVFTLKRHKQDNAKSDELSSSFSPTRTQALSLSIDQSLSAFFFWIEQISLLPIRI